MEHEELRTKIRTTWKKTLGKMDRHDHVSNFKKARGPISSIFAVLTELGMDPL